MRYVIAVLAIGGIVVSSLALAGHYAAPVLPIEVLHSNWNSDYVNQSPLAEVLGVPLAVLGIAGYALLMVLALLRRTLLTVYFAGIGLACALDVTDIEAHILRVWCAYWVSSLIINILITFVAFWSLISDPTPRRPLNS